MSIDRLTIPGPWFRDPHQDALMLRATEMGISVRDLSKEWGHDAVEYSAGGRCAVVIQGRAVPGLSYTSQFICDHKHACKEVLREIGLPVPKGVFFRDPDFGDDAEAVRSLLAAGSRWVMKPDVGSHGAGIRFDIERHEEVVAHWQALGGDLGGYVLEAEISGEDLRLQALDGRLFAACIRHPASVVGDGIQTVQALTEARAEYVRSLNTQNRLELDADALELLRRQGLTPESVPEMNRSVVLSRCANVARGGHAVDVTPQLHPRYASWIDGIARRLMLSFFAVDVITEDVRRDPVESGCVLEVNARPQWLHHSFSEGQQHDVAGKLLQALLTG